MKKVIIFIIGVIMVAGCTELIPSMQLEVYNKYEPKEVNCALVNHGDWNEEKFKQDNMIAVAMLTTGNVDYVKNEKTVSETGCKSGADGYFVMKRWKHQYQSGGSQFLVTVYFVKHRNQGEK